MSHQRIPADWTIQRSTQFFTKENVPAALLSHHNTAEGVFGQLCVMEGVVTYFGFPDAETETPVHFVNIIKIRCNQLNLFPVWQSSTLHLLFSGGS